MFCVRFFHRSLLILNFKIKIKMQQQHWFKVALNLLLHLPGNIRMYKLISSPEPKARVSFSDQD